MREPFKFRYVNELAGGFVILAAVLLLAGVFMAGRSQGWFEKKFRLTSVFTTIEGSFGLKEGDEVRVRNTVAGRVERIRPTEDGQLEATFVVLNRFRPFIRQDSVARVRKKFGVAGDSFVEIEMGKGPVAEYWGRIECRKDEAIMDTAQKLLRDVQEVGMPMLKEVQEILTRVRSISAKVESGEGTAGMVLNDPGMADSIKSAVTGVEGLVRDTREAVTETTRLVRGFQNHWLVRKYIPPDRVLNAVSIEYLASQDRRLLVGRLNEGLESGRRTDDPSVVIAASELLASLCLAETRTSDARKHIAEMRHEAQRTGTDLLPAYLLECEALIREGNVKGAREKLDEARSVRPEPGKAGRRRIALMDAAIACAEGNYDSAVSSAFEAARRLDSDESVELQGQAAWIRMQAHVGANRPLEAARAADDAASYLRSAQLLGGMATALASAGKCYGDAGRPADAADRLFRAGRALAAQGSTEIAVRELKQATAFAEQAGDASLKDLTGALIANIEKTGKP